MLTLEDVARLTPEELAVVPQEELWAVAATLQRRRVEVQQERQLLLYEPASSEARRMHESRAREIVIAAGNRSGKTDMALVELVIAMTGIVPYALESTYPREKIRPPIRARVCCQSFTTTLHPVIFPKLQWWEWNGPGEPGGSRGHWGWIPQEMLKGRDWSKAWSEKYRTLSLSNGSTCQFFSYDQPAEDHSGASCHVVLHDEGPPQATYRENRLRTLDVGGRCYIAFTPPDDERMSWDAAWVFDALYEKGQPGPGKDPDIDAFTLNTEDNRVLSPQDVQAISKGLTPAQREVRLHGRFMHLTGRIYPLYTERERWWCLMCAAEVLVEGGACLECGTASATPYTHWVEPFAIPEGWPVVYVLDPHPRKPHAMAWFAISPADQVYEVGELEVDGDPATVRDRVEQLERQHGWQVVLRLIDPNMGQSPSGMRRGITVRDEFDGVGLRCRLANDNRMTARTRLRQWLQPDGRTSEPRLQVFQTCPRTNYQMQRYVWDQWSRWGEGEKNPKPIPRDLHDDFPTILGYLANENPSYAWLAQGWSPTKREVRAYG